MREDDRDAAPLRRPARPVGCAAARSRYKPAPMAASTSESFDPMRYVLTGDAPLTRNLAALGAVDPRLAADLEALHPAPPYPPARPLAP